MEQREDEVNESEEIETFDVTITSENEDEGTENTPPINTEEGVSSSQVSDESPTETIEITENEPVNPPDTVSKEETNDEEAKKLGVYSVNDFEDENAEEKEILERQKREEEEKEREEEEQRYFVSSHNSDTKHSFNEINGIKEKKERKPGKVNKTAILIVIFSILISFSVILTIASSYKKKKAKVATAKEEKVQTGDYNLNVGDYKSREYVATKEEEEIANLREVEDTFLNEKGKAEYKKEVTTPPNKSEQKTQSYYNSVNPTKRNKEIDDTASLSSLRYLGEGFGYESKDYVPPVQVDSNPYSFSEDDIANRYIERAKEVNNSFNASSSSNTDEMRYSTAGVYDPTKEGGQITGINDNSLFPGTIIPAVLVNGINTDYPGTITARVTSPVYDSKTGHVLLIPSGSILRGSYSSSSIGVKRIQIAWQSLIISRDGKSYMVNLGSMVGTDKSGYSGIGGSLNEHVFAHLKALGYSTLSTVLNHSIYSVIKGTRNELYKELLGDTQEMGNDFTNKMMDRALDIQPTVTVKPGTIVNVDVDQVLTLVPFKQDIKGER